MKQGSFIGDRIKYVFNGPGGTLMYNVYLVGRLHSYVQIRLHFYVVYLAMMGLSLYVRT